MDPTKIAKIGDAIKSRDVGHLVIDNNKILSKNEIKGLNIYEEEIEDGVNIRIEVDDGAIIKNPVHLCFGLSKDGFLQRINMDVHVGKGAEINILSHCVLMKRGKHAMESKVLIDEGGSYSYIERHIHGMEKVEVYPTAKVEIMDGGRFRTDFELLRGRVGIIGIDYEITGHKNSTLDLTTKVNGIKDDIIKIKEYGYLVGERSKGALRSRIAVRNQARAEVYNKMVATAAYARGHVDCKEVIQDNGVATAVPIVEVKHPKAHVTHEASIGSVDKKQLETLMSRGLKEEEAVEIIIEGLLS